MIECLYDNELYSNITVSCLKRDILRWQDKVGRGLEVAGWFRIRITSFDRKMHFFQSILSMQPCNAQQHINCEVQCIGRSTFVRHFSLSPQATISFLFLLCLSLSLSLLSSFLLLYLSLLLRLSIFLSPLLPAIGRSSLNKSYRIKYAFEI